MHFYSKGLAFLFLAFIITGCASMRWSDYKKKVLISSQPQGATVFLDGKELGQTPLFVDVRRGKKIKYVLLDRTGKKHEVEGNDGIRWIDSVLSNGVFSAAAPVGWGIDWWTGTIWDPKSRVNVILEPTAVADPVKKVAFVPLSYDDPVLSIALSKYIEDRVHKEFPNATLVDFSKTAARFEAGGYSWNSRNYDEKFNRLVEELDVSHLAESKIEEKDGETIVQIRLRDIHSGETFPIKELRLREEKIEVLRRSELRKFWDQNVAFIPNTFSAKLASTHLSVDFENQLIETIGKVMPANNFFGDLGQFMGAVSLSVKRGPALPQRQRLLLSFTPDFGFSWQKIRFFEHEANQTDFRRLKAYVGFGPQLEWEGQLGVLYLAVRGVGLYSQLEAGQQNFSDFASGVGVSIGYYKFLSDRWVVQLFLDQTPESDAIWKKAFSKTSGGTLKMTDAREVVGGISLGYYFPELRHGYFWHDQRAAEKRKLKQRSN